MIIYDRRRYSDYAWWNLHRDDPRRWELDHGHCPRCGSWIHGIELLEDERCIVCNGREVIDDRARADLAVQWFVDTRQGAKGRR